MSRQLPVPFRSGRAPMADRPEVIVVEQGLSGRLEQLNPLARLIVSLAPDVLRALDRSRSRRTGPATTTVATPRESRIVHTGVQLSEVEYDLRLPFVRQVTFRKAIAWTSDRPASVVEAPPKVGRLRRAGFVSVSAFIVAAAGLLANRAAGSQNVGSRRG